MLAWIAFAIPCCIAQNERWTLLDSAHARVPVLDLKLAASFRMMQNDNVRFCAWEVARRHSEITSLTEEGRRKDVEKKALNDLNTKLESKVQDVTIELGEANETIRSLRPWATASKLGVVLAVVLVGLRIVAP